MQLNVIHITAITCVGKHYIGPVGWPTGSIDPVGWQYIGHEAGF